MPDETDRERYIRFQNSFHIHIGDYVKVIYKAHSRENGWSNAWVSEMDVAIGCIGRVSEIKSNGINGIRLDIPSVSRPYLYPYFSLQIVR